MMLTSVESKLDLDAYFQEQMTRPKRYGGQLSPPFQKALEDYHAGITEEDCDFYHTIDLGDGRLRTGAWDLRGHEEVYLGCCDVTGKRVIEAGPASGFLSAYMASKGADLVVFDLPFGGGPELVPFAEANMGELAASGRQSMKRLRNSWWYTKRKLGFQACAIYGDIYDPPKDIGRFDISVFGAILLHLSNPFRALQALSAMTNDTLIVTDVWNAFSTETGAGANSLRKAHMIFAPSALPSGIVHWWGLSPEAICHMLERLGFPNTTVTKHVPKNMPSAPSMFTVVARRAAR
ncbi:hypothetical protein LG047_05385 [Methylocystis sp. WRRC1]|uniref:class I SAM-dependent methyltransferase n=1 Tax=Methylocystis sp. WRRC1 TaxID=1732014 RepID=UPI001D148711|nr:methyltransferase domain-containing protein [Methylocystis sp. WRRC1]MCC3244757.1 hypothetical protein [Methylocystis sp. WRRC1]